MPPIPAPYPPLQDKVLYFAYGANVSSKTLLKRGLNKVPPGIVAQVTHPNIALVFGHRGGYATLTQVEGANTKEKPLQQPWWQWLQLDKNSSSTAARRLNKNQGQKNKGILESNLDNTTGVVYWQPYGMLYELTQEQLQLIEAKEIGYQRKIISVSTSSSYSAATDTDTATTTETKTTIVDAIVFISAPWMTLRHPVAPVQRYRDLILQGALENKLPKPYINWLHQLPVVEASVLGSAEYSHTMAEVVLKSIGVGVLVIMGIQCTMFGH